jgi:hypothetical protein
MPQISPVQSSQNIMQLPVPMVSNDILIILDFCNGGNSCEEKINMTVLETR